MTVTPRTRPFRFGVQTGSSRPEQSWGDFAREVEALGYATLTCPDHFVDQELAPVVALSIAAAATTNLRVGALVFDNDYKHPAILAKEMATLDQLSNGRVELGIGAGWMRSDYDALGLPYDAAGARIDRMIEGLDVMEQCFAPGAFSYTGEHYTITEYDALPKPAQAHIPINIGGGGKRVLTIAAQRADIIGINPNLRKGEITADAAQDSLEHMWQQKLEWIREAAGARFNDLELQIRSFMVAVTDDRMGLAEVMAPAFGVSPEDALASHAVLAGTIEELIDQCIEGRERYGVSYWIVGEDVFREFAPVVARLAGT
ncbi:MAG: TIGR03621 family F420-dependent LLM class oxidoreductase [Acidimicrobiia bacterium]